MYPPEGVLNEASEDHGPTKSPLRARTFHLCGASNSSPHDGVYVTSPAAELPELLKRVRQPFLCYGFNREGRDGNLWFKKPSQENFLKDLGAARAVVANSGFSLISEAPP